MSEGARTEARSTTLGSVVVPPFRDPVVVFLLLAGFFDGISGNPIHSILLFSTAVALGRDALLRHRGVTREPTRAEPWPEPSSAWSMPLAVGAAIAYSVFFAGFARYSWPITFAVVVPGATGLMIGWHGSIRVRPEANWSLTRVGVLAWASVFVAASLWELVALFQQPTLTTDSQTHPTISVMTDPLLASHPGRAIGLFAWLAFGWFLVKR
jgi:hypothetical protein